jgi:hypothetical protein
MNTRFLFFYLLVISISSSCGVTKKGADRANTKFIRKNLNSIKDAAEFAVQATYNNSKRTFIASEVNDKVMRRKIQAIGNEVSVSFKERTYSEIPDSVVTFERMTLLGVTEVIYDFAEIPRILMDNTTNKQEYYFIKIADRVYYRRRPIPMM